MNQDIMTNPERQSIEAEAAGLCPAAVAVLADLQKAHAYACRLGRDCWDFSVELQYLVALGATVSDLRFLVINGYIEHAREITRLVDPSRRYAPSRRYESSSNFAFVPASCFVATQAGLAILEAAAHPRNLSIRLGAGLDPVESGFANAEAAVTLPRWDAASLLLSFGGHVVKRYRLPYTNQAPILAAFEASGWPQSIDDPLPYLRRDLAKERLHATIRCLNGNQQARLIRFRGNGTGESVLWEPTSESAAESRSPRLGFPRAA